MTWRVLISAPYFLLVIEEFRARLESADVEIVKMPVGERLSETDLLPIVGTIDGAICGDDQFTAVVLEQAGRLKVISKWGTGIDSIDRDAAARLGIRVCNTENAFTDAVADTTLGYILSFARGLPWMDQEVRRGLWTKPELISLRECTLGIVGVGNIGKAVARRARSFGMTVIGNDRKQIEDSFIRETGLSVLSLHELLPQADFVSLHCDLNPTSFHLIGPAELKLMKASACLINTSRGAVVDEAALVEALRGDKISGAALDVFEVEPLPSGSPLRQLPNCLLAPHNANSSPEARRRVHEATIENLLQVLRESQ
jgi:D-3-phosphoglycerate dehydrogenase